MYLSGNNLTDKGFDNVNKIGSCAVVVVVANDKVYTSALGDSQAALLTKRPPTAREEDLGFSSKGKESKLYNIKMLNFCQSANSDIEQKRLRA